MSAEGGPLAQHQPFSVARLRGGAFFFALGKVGSGLIGLAWLLVLVRVLDLPSYAAYIVLVAVLEITLLVSNGGVFAFAQRYVTEARLPHNLHLLNKLVWMSLGYRVLTLALATGLLALAASPLSEWLGQPLIAQLLPLYAGVIVLEGSVRYLELVFESLLEQGRAQVCGLLRNGLRLLIVLWWWRAGGDGLGLVAVLKTELFTAALGLTCAMVLVGIRRGETRHQSTQQASSFAVSRFVSFAVPLYLAQCMTQLYSPDTIKLIISRLLGAAEAAAFGYAHVISNVLQRYLPASLLLGLIRPMLVARQNQDPSQSQLTAVGNLVLKINLLLLLPLTAWFGVAGAEFAAWLSGGRYAQAGFMLFLLTLVLVLTGTHQVLSMLATTVENSRAILWGTAVSVPGVVLGIALSSRLGSTAMILGLATSEILWCSFAVWALKRGGFTFRIDWGAWLKFAAVTLAAGLGAELAVAGLGVAGGTRLILAGAVASVLYLVGVLLMRPFNADERRQMQRMLPARFRGQQG